MSAVMRNQPQTPAERIIFWVDYVLKFNGAEHLKTGATNLWFYQYHMLDVYLVLLAVIVCVILVLKASCSFCYKRFCKSKIKQQ